ncbi:dienelactone hydrolase family protein [Ramlibacter sp. MAHUQ-53]|uniref:dienelactone hydrolase family protein n=1 Tax=unclassified Ramlibacter TaxID=2617605 RepID=UPI003638C4D7
MGARAAEPEAVAFDSLDGTPLQAWVYRPEGPPRGAVVALHGCGGLYARAGARAGRLNPRHHAMGEWLQARGYLAVFPDSLRPRGIDSLCAQKFAERRIDPGGRRADAQAAMAWAAGQPGSDANRIALLGWSHGGSTLLATTNANREEVRRHPVQPRVAVGFYPGCGASLRAGYRAAVPLVLMLGELDDWTPPGPCVELGQAVGAEVHVFPGSYHDFDTPVGRVVLRTDIPNGLRPEMGVHTGPNPAAREAAYRRLAEVLDTALR